MKRCTKCGELKPLDSFYAKGAGQRPECIPCYSKMNAAWYAQKHKIRRRREHRQEYVKAKQIWDRIHVKLDKEEGAQLRAFARSNRMTVADAIRECITWRLEE